MKEIIWESCTTILVWRVYLEIGARNQHCGAINVNLYSLTCLKDNKKLLYNSEFNINTQIIPSFCVSWIHFRWLWWIVLWGVAGNWTPKEVKASVIINKIWRLGCLYKHKQCQANNLRKSQNTGKGGDLKIILPDTLEMSLLWQECADVEILNFTVYLYIFLWSFWHLRGTHLADVKFHWVLMQKPFSFRWKNICFGKLQWNGRQ